MTTRRSFLGAVAGGIGGGDGACAGSPTRRRPASRRSACSCRACARQLAKDVPGTLEQIKAWGFDEVETFGKFGAEIAAELKAAGLTVRADARRATTGSRSDLAGVLKDADAVGAPRPSSTPTCRTRRSRRRRARRS